MNDSLGVFLTKLTVLTVFIYWVVWCAVTAAG